jgi:hypothetical protein
MPERRRQLLLAALLVVLAVVLYRIWAGPAAPPSTASNPGETGRRPAGGGVTAPDVKLESLESERPAPGEGANRNLFRFGRPPAPEVAPAPPRGPGPAPAPPVASGPTTPAVPPIPLKLIGFMEVPGRGKMAILADTTGKDPQSGFEGDVILGQYRIVRIAADSIEMAYLDGRGRQTIRLPGS